ARILKAKFRRVGEFGKAGVEIAGEAAAGEEAVEFSDGCGSGFEGTADGAKAIGEFFENAEDFGGFVFGKLNELVVALDGFEGFHEDGLAGAAGAVNDTLNIAAMFGANGDDEAIVAKGDVIFAGFRLTRAEDLLQGSLDGISRLKNSSANAAKSGG